MTEIISLSAVFIILCLIAHFSAGPHVRVLHKAYLVMASAAVGIASIYLDPILTAFFASLRL